MPGSGHGGEEAHDPVRSLRIRWTPGVGGATAEVGKLGQDVGSQSQAFQVSDWEWQAAHWLLGGAQGDIQLGFLEEQEGLKPWADSTPPQRSRKEGRLEPSSGHSQAHRGGALW